MSRINLTKIASSSSGDGLGCFFHLESGEPPLILSLNALSEVISKLLTHHISTAVLFESPSLC